MAQIADIQRSVTGNWKPSQAQIDAEAAANAQAAAEKEGRVAARIAERQAARAEARAGESGQAPQPGGNQETRPTQPQKQAAEPRQQTTGSEGKGPATAGRDFGPGGPDSSQLNAGRTFAQTGSAESVRRGLAGAIFSPRSLFSNPGQGRFRTTGGGPSNPLGGLARAMVVGGRGGGAPSGSLATPSSGFLGSSVMEGQQDPQQQLLQILQQASF